MTQNPGAITKEYIFTIYEGMCWTLLDSRKNSRLNQKFDILSPHSLVPNFWETIGIGEENVSFWIFK